MRPRPRDATGRSRLHDDGHDHRPTPRSLVDELARGATHVTLEGLDVAYSTAERALDGLSHGVAGLIEQVLGLGRVHPAAGDDLGTGDDLSGLHIDGDHHHDHTLLGEHPAVTDDSGADIADDPVDVDVTGWDPFAEAETVVVDDDDVAVLAEHDLVVGDTHPPAECRVGDQVAVFPMDRHVPLGFDDGEIGLDVVGLRVDIFFYIAINLNTLPRF